MKMVEPEKCGNRGLFELQTSRQLFEKAVRDATRFRHEPTDDNLFNYLCTLNHLRDWLCPGGWASYRDKPEETLTRAERLHQELHEDADYCIVRDLCNNAKHFVDSGIGTHTRVTRGFFVGSNCVGDHLNERNLMVDGRNVRSVAGNVLKRFAEFFSATGAEI